MYYEQDEALIKINKQLVKSRFGQNHHIIDSPSQIRQKEEELYEREKKLMEEWFFIFDENLSSETCKTFTEKDNILDGYIDEFSPEVKHNRTKLFDNINIFEKKIMEKHRKEYAKTGKARKPTEILIFTDGYSFSCASYFTKELQIYGAAITAGYNIRPDLVNTVIDASQSNSPPDIFPTTEYTKTLTKYGYTPYITYIETFDFNDLTPPKVPMEFKVYPVDFGIFIIVFLLLFFILEL